MLVFAAALSLGAPNLELDTRTPSSSRVAEVSVHVGAGYGDDAVGLIRPRLRYELPRFSLTVGAPVVVGDGSRFDTPEAWVAWLEELDLDLEGLALRIAPLVDHGRGLTVDRLTSRLGPVDLRSGLTVRWSGGRQSLQVFSDGVLDPRALGAAWTWNLYEGTSTRAALSATGALDPDAPSRLGPTLVAAADVSAAVEQLIASGFALEWRAGFGGLFRDQPAAAGIGTSAALRVGPADRHFRIEGGVRRAGNGYIASYFDRLYATERDSFEGTAKADQGQAGGWIARGAVRAEIDGLSFELGAEEGAIPGDLRLEAEVALADDDWQLRAIGAQRAVGGAREVFELEETTYVSVDFAHRIWRSLFAFAALSHRTEDGTVVREGFAGIGFGQSVRWSR